VSKYNK
jgi:hypothetical protein